jgi:hypothetical protein
MDDGEHCLCGGRVTVGLSEGARALEASAAMMRAADLEAMAEGADNECRRKPQTLRMKCGMQMLN